MGFSEREWPGIGRFMRSICAVLGLGLTIGLLGCPSRTSEDAAVDFDAGEPDAGVIDAGPPLPATIEPTIVANGRDGGMATVTGDAVIDDVIGLTVSLPVRLKDFRLRVMDWRDRVVPSDDELMADGKTYVIALLAPLETGRPYTLRLDAELGPVISDDTGGTWNDWDLKFKIAGEVQPDPSPAKKKKRR